MAEGDSATSDSTAGDSDRSSSTSSSSPSSSPSKALRPGRSSVTPSAPLDAEEALLLDTERQLERRLNRRGGTDGRLPPSRPRRTRGSTGWK